MNLVLWSLQATIVVAVAALIAALVRSAHPKARLALWQLALLATLLLPVVRPWESEVVTDLKLTHAAAALPAPAATPHASTPRLPDPWQALDMLLAAGIVVRLALVAVGLIRLRKYRREARRYITDAVWHTEAELLISDAVPSPVTFGFMRPVVLLPTHFASLDTPLRETILYHEILHVRRRDWLFAVAEEAIRAVLWFHPAIWWAVREIQLTREEAVDREVVETMNAREAYVDALLAIAATPVADSMRARDMAPAPFFLRRKHLKHRVVSIFREVNMSNTKSVSALLAGCCALALSCWYITGALPLQAQPTEVIDAEGVSVDIGGARLMHRTSVVYPSYAVGDRVQGTVVAQVRTDANGNVVDAQITAGPDELRKAVLTSVLNWHFAHDSANTTRQVSVTFTLPERFNTPRPAPNAVPATVRMGTPNLMLPIGSIKVVGLSDEQRDELLAKLPLHVGDTPTTPTLFQTMKVVHEFDEHLTVVTSRREGDNQQELRIAFPPVGAIAPPPPPPPPPPPADAAKLTPAPGAARVGANVMAQNLVTKVEPTYPELAKAAGVQGTVRFQIEIGTDGTVQKATLVSGAPLLVQAALQAVRQWVYKPTYLNGQAVPVVTTVDLNFTLAQ
jgi:TonB family protein